MGTRQVLVIIYGISATAYTWERKLLVIEDYQIDIVSYYPYVELM